MTIISTRIALPIVVLTTLMLQSCGENKAEVPQQHSGVILANMDTLVKPGDDFAAYVNGAWDKLNDIPADKSSFGVGSMLNDKAREDVKAIIEDAAKGENADGSAEQKIGDLYASYLDMSAREQQGVSPISADLAKIDALKTPADLAAYFGYANKSGIDIPFAIGVIEDFKDPTIYKIYSWQSGLGLPEKEYYMLTDEKSKTLRTKYEQHIAKMLGLAGVKDGAKKAAGILKLETAFATQHMSKEQTRDMAGLYNLYETSKLDSILPAFDWNAFFENAEIPAQKDIIVTQVDYLTSLKDLMAKTPMNVWKDYLKWQVIHNAASSLTKKMDNENFAFYGKILYGKPQQEADWKRAVGVVNNNLGEIVGEVYVKKHFSPEAKKSMTELVQNLLKAYESSIKNLDWMSPATKDEALKKISKFTIKIGYPDKWRDYSALKIAKGDLYTNLQNASNFEYKRQIGKLGKPVDKTEWGMTPQTVNAYYNPMANEIVFPAAILQPPFFDLKAEDAINYGGIGAVIGHEIGHGFDDQGSTFDGDGVMRNWWTPEDLSAFKAKTNALVEQYNGFAVFDDLNVNGAFTLGENIGDLGGLTIALKAYNMSLKGKKAPTMDGFTGQQRVFIGWAQVWLEKSRDEALRNQIASDPHSPARFRVNGIVRNIPEWYKAFDVKPTDSLYLAPEKRVKIW